MPVPTYSCPYKVKPTTDVGIVCENVLCGAYDGEEEHCGFILDMRQRNTMNTTKEPNNA